LSTFENTELTIKGRHDPCIALRAVPVIEAVTAAVILDIILEEKQDGAF
ncbi:MAG: chorismate synthase, partial [Oscillospiraceae bacterium]|nr:chorismate synthase [Oscillospiraceae bacterium]